MEMIIGGEVFGILMMCGFCDRLYCCHFT